VSKADAKAATPKTGRRGSGRWLQGLVCGAVVTLATPTALLGGVLLLPAIIVYFLEDDDGRPTVRAVLLFGLAGALRPMIALWSGGHTVAISMSLLSDIAVPALAWSAQGAGWLLAQLIPLLVRVTLEAHNRVEIAKLRAERGKLAKQWGLPASPGAPGDATAEP
jgi:hypothetical protein